MSSSVAPVVRFFQSQSEYLNDLRGLRYMERASASYQGWYDFTDVFVDNVVFWCTTLLYLAKNSKEIGQYVAKIRAAFSRHLDPASFTVMYVCSGRCPDDCVIPEDFHRTKSAQLNFQDHWDYVKGFIQIKVSFDELALQVVLQVLRNVERELLDNLTVLHDLDVTVDCALVSTRDIIEDYIVQSLNVDPKDIVQDRHKVGDHCISWLCQTTGVNVVDLRVKIYNKFVQMIESTDARSSVGSQLSNFVTNKSQRFTEKLLRYRDSGMTRFEITLYTKDIFSTEDYVILINDLIEMSGCPTYEVNFGEHWSMVVQRIRSLVALYDPEKRVFAYCHWWNSLTKRFQGLVKEGIAEKTVPSLLANLSFNDRPIHYFIVRLSNKAYEAVDHLEYRRNAGCTALTIVPGPANSLFPRVDKIVDRKVLAFPIMGFHAVDNITLGWSTGRYRDNGIVDGVQIQAVTDISPEQADRVGLQRLDSVNMSMYRPDYDVLEIDRVYKGGHLEPHVRWFSR